MRETPLDIFIAKTDEFIEMHEDAIVKHKERARSSRLPEMKDFWNEQLAIEMQQLEDERIAKREYLQRRAAWLANKEYK